MITNVPDNLGARFNTEPSLSAWPDKASILLPAGATFIVTKHVKEVTLGVERSKVNLRYMGEWYKKPLSTLTKMKRGLVSCGVCCGANAEAHPEARRGLSRAVNIMEQKTGWHLDGDGDVGVNFIDASDKYLELELEHEPEAEAGLMALMPGAVGQHPELMVGQVTVQESQRRFANSTAGALMGKTNAPGGGFAVAGSITLKKQHYEGKLHETNPLKYELTVTHGMHESDYLAVQREASTWLD